MTHAKMRYGNVRLPLTRILTLALAGAFAGLTVDVRVEHVDAVREHAVAWLPIVYCGAMAIGCCISFVVWNQRVRLAMVVLFALAFAIGGTGFYFHNQGRLTDVLRSSVNAWIDPKMRFPDGPPQVAPLALAGLGMIGILASLKRFDA